jgi:hypothetical protein
LPLNGSNEPQRMIEVKGEGAGWEVVVPMTGDMTRSPDWSRLSPA